ncbi:MAG: hypothetical protein WDN69_29460 [Aliidongia sp.]
MLLKETSTDLRYLDRVAELLRDAEAPAARDLIILMRDPVPIFLSEMQARQEWWGKKSSPCLYMSSTNGRDAS